MTDNELKPCPFCGGKPQFDECYDNASKRYSITCFNCGIEMRRWESTEDKSKIIAAWNRRANEQAENKG